MDQPREIRRLNSLRGLAALIVLVSHYSHETMLLGGMFDRGAGQFGVMLFFLLSAFLITYLYLDTPPSPKGIANYAISRIARVIPLYLFVVTLSFVAKQFLPGSMSAYAFNIPNGNELLAHLMFLHGNSVLWTIPPEIHFYIIFTLFWLLWPRMPRLVHVLVPCLLLLSAATVSHTVPQIIFYDLVATPVILNVFPYFATGMLMGILYRRWQPATRWKSHYYALALLAIPLLYPAILLQLTGISHRMWEDPAILIAMATIFFLVVFMVPEKNPVLENRLGDFLGKISYSLYLLHIPLMLVLQNLGLIGGLGGLVAFLLFTCGMSYLSFRFLESPARKWIRAIKFSTSTNGKQLATGAK